MLFPFKEGNQKLEKEGGFSLVELMVVVGIIGILAALAVPKFQLFQAKARMSEAKGTLSHIYTLQEAYHLETNSYTAFTTTFRNFDSGNPPCVTPAAHAPLGIDFTPCNAKSPRYAYVGQTGTASAFTVTAASGSGTDNKVCPGYEQHAFQIDQDKDLTFSITATAATQGAVGPARCGSETTSNTGPS